MECALRNDVETLKGPCVKVTHEEGDNSSEIMNDKWTKNVW